MSKDRNNNEPLANNILKFETKTKEENLDEVDYDALQSNNILLTAALGLDFERLALIGLTEEGEITVMETFQNPSNTITMFEIGKTFVLNKLITPDPIQVGANENTDS
ncbi:MAG: hypothetical protein KDH96_09315 [Candidatus Riesia sp.]|nr:hypothetical protein [Candidatus Riesia sp.]